MNKVLLYSTENLWQRLAVGAGAPDSIPLSSSSFVLFSAQAWWGRVQGWTLLMGLQGLSSGRIVCQLTVCHTPTQLPHGPLGESQRKLVSTHLKWKGLCDISPVRVAREGGENCEPLKSRDHLTV